MLSQIAHMENGGMYGLHARDKQTTICYLNDILGTSPRPTDLMLVVYYCVVH